MKIIIIDNYDSFTYNLAHFVRELGAEADVLRNDRFRLEELDKYDKIILSPGPGIPAEAGLLTAVVRTYAGRKPMLGVCLGHQAIGEVFGAKLTNLKEVYHGVQCTLLTHADEKLQTPDGTLQPEEDYLFRGLPATMPVGRYHSWVVDTEDFPTDTLAVTALSPEGHIMALKHRRLDVHGIQFHPESVLTPDGKRIIENFLAGDMPCRN